jgi:hypothetical protein
MLDAPLTVHPEHRSDAVTAGRFWAKRWGSLVVLNYNFLCRRTEIVLPAPMGARDEHGLYAPVRGDELWKSTCFELFVRPVGGGTAYFEYNFTPAMKWAAYRFSDRRVGMMNVTPEEPPQLWDNKSSGDYTYCVSLRLDKAWAERTLRFAVSAVIEENDGRKSYWALRHGEGPPDFHDPESFVFDIGPQER